tara:strand:+ start:864 stop:1082 length:219 start_codon:yes stop_codon:yes gene_type:complete
MEKSKKWDNIKGAEKRLGKRNRRKETDRVRWGYKKDGSAYLIVSPSQETVKKWMDSGEKCLTDKAVAMYNKS